MNTGEQATTQEGSFRDYTFYAGPLRNQKVRNVSDKMLAWAVRFNREYVRTHMDPTAGVRYRGRYVTVGTLPQDVVERRLASARTALDACLAEQRYRQEEASLAATEAPPAPPARPAIPVQELIAMARRESAIRTASEMVQVAKQLVAVATRLSDLASGLGTAFAEDAKVVDDGC